MSTRQSTGIRELKLCEFCFMMTNHAEGYCLKCPSMGHRWKHKTRGTVYESVEFYEHAPQIVTVERLGQRYIVERDSLVLA